MKIYFDVFLIFTSFSLEVTVYCNINNIKPIKYNDFDWTCFPYLYLYIFYLPVT